MPWKKVFGSCLALVDATDEEIRQQAIQHSLTELTEEEIREYIKKYRISEQKKLEIEPAGSWNSYVIVKVDYDSPEYKGEAKSIISPASISRSKSKDASANKRQELYNVIVNKENKIEDLSHFKQAVQLSNDRFLTHSKHSLGVAEESFYHLSAAAPGQAQREQEQLQEIQHELESRIENQNETLETSCRSTMRTMENEVEDLHKERNALPW